MAVPSSAVFSMCQISIIRSAGLKEPHAQSLEETLAVSGAQIVSLQKDGTVKLDEVTHIISVTSDFPQYDQACDVMLPVVTPAWITASLLKCKQAQIRPFTPDPRLFFSGVVVSCADIPDGDKHAIVGAVMAMGGQESNALTKQVTHLVALTQDHPKCQAVIAGKYKCKIVLPHWFDDCLKLGKRIDENPYILPDPEILFKNASDNVKIPDSDHIRSALSARPAFLPTPTDTPRALSVFQNKAVMLSSDLGLGDRLRAVLEGLIESSGGKITSTVDKADMYICHWREGDDYVAASRARKDVGNLSWLYHLITRDEWTSPFRRLLHYPLPRNGIPGFETTRITLSNYGGDARVYLENLVTAAGGIFTKTMKADNTHLITARKNSEKCIAAGEWNINMVNHLWIEESYALCRLQNLTNPAYTHFPPRTNLGEVIGQTQFNTALLEELYFPPDPNASPIVMKDRPSSQQNNPQAHSQGPGSKIVVGRQYHPEFDVERDPEAEVIAKSTEMFGLPVSKPHITPQNFSTPATNRYIATGKENETPSSTGSRSAKNKALSKLHDLAPDIALYEKEKKRAGGGLWGGKRALDQIDRKPSGQGSRTSASPDQDDEAEAQSGDEEERVSKKPKVAKPKAEIRLLITGYRKWLNEPAKEEKDKKKLRDMGILVVNDPLHCTHLAAPAMVRTQKFLCALAISPFVVTSAFIDACLESGSVPSVDKYVLKDKDNEKKFNIKLDDILTRAKKNSRHLLTGTAVFSSPDIANGPDTYKSIVDANGGSFAIFRGQQGSMPRNRDQNVDIEYVYLLTSSNQKERAMWEKFKDMAKEAGFEPRVVQTDWLLDAAMKQRMEWKNSYLAK